MEQSLVLGYWPFQGRVQPIRYLLKYVNAEYSEKLYFESSDWLKGDKITSEFEHVELPYLKESENSGVEIVSGFEDILGHLNNKFGLEAKTDEENEKYKSVLADCMKLFQKTEKLVYDIAQ